MLRIRTHYDNLKVARDAPIEVIRAAYRTLAAKYHPDHNPGNARCARISQIINTSYEVLSDPAKRAQHDRWIASAEPDLGRSTSAASEEAPHSPWPERCTANSADPAPETPYSPPTPPTLYEESERKQSGCWVRLRSFCFILGANVFDSFKGEWSHSPSREVSATESPALPAPQAPVATPVPEIRPVPAVKPRVYERRPEQPSVYAVATPRFVRPPLAPNGEPWPPKSGLPTKALRCSIPAVARICPLTTAEVDQM